MTPGQAGAGAESLVWAGTGPLLAPDVTATAESGPWPEGVVAAEPLLWSEAWPLSAAAGADSISASESPGAPAASAGCESL